MQTTIHIEGMSCSHCEAAVKKAVSELNGVKAVSVSLAGKTATVEYDPAAVNLDQMKAAIEDAGYDVV